ncbi:MAG: hypothetical protein VW868_05795, partial [Bacteroidota bacterium]
LTDYLFSKEAVKDGYLDDSAIKNLLRLAKINALNTTAAQRYSQELTPTLESVNIDTQALNASIPYIF